MGLKEKQTRDRTGYFTVEAAIENESLSLSIKEKIHLSFERQFLYLVTNSLDKKLFWRVHMCI